MLIKKQLAYEERVHNIMMQHLKVLMPKPLLYVPLPASEIVVHHEHLVPIQHQLVY